MRKEVKIAGPEEKRGKKALLLEPRLFCLFSQSPSTLPPVKPPSQPGLFYKVLLRGLASQFVNT